MAVCLSVDDWIEIYSALESMAKKVGSGVYDIRELELDERDTPATQARQLQEHAEHEALERRRWVAHLESIMTRIGPDGDEAATEGVAVAAP